MNGLPRINLFKKVNFAIAFSVPGGKDIFLMGENLGVGWVFKNIFLLSKALAAKCAWRLINRLGLWCQVVVYKYIISDSLEGWIIKRYKECHNVSVMRKVDIRAFPLIGKDLAWIIGDDAWVKIGEDAWVAASARNHLLPLQMIQKLKDRGTFDNVSYCKFGHNVHLGPGMAYSR